MLVLGQSLRVALTAQAHEFVVGYMIGTHPVSRPVLGGSPATVSSASDAVPGQTYLELRTRRFGPNGSTANSGRDFS